MIRGSKVSLAALALVTSQVLAQEQPAAPVLTGAIGFTANVGTAPQSFGPKFEPILLMPLGNKFLVESEYSMELPVERDQGKFGPAQLNHSFEYLQLDYLVNKDLTLVAGYFVTPFGLYKERMDPQWIRNIQEPPLLFGLNDQSSNGLELRGAHYISAKLKLNYAAFYSAESSASQFTSEQRTGGRLGLLLSGPRLEVGASYNHRFDRMVPFNTAGFDITWNARKMPLDLRGEYEHTDKLGWGYWAEGAYRLSRLSNPLLRRSQLVLREQRYSPHVLDGVDEGLPGTVTHRTDVGYNYAFNDSWKAVSSFGRTWADDGNARVWTVGLIYRFTTSGGR